LAITGRNRTIYKPTLAARRVRSSVVLAGSFMAVPDTTIVNMRLGNRYGYQKLFTAGLVLFTVGSSCSRWPAWPAASRQLVLIPLATRPSATPRDRLGVKREGSRAANEPAGEEECQTYSMS
jgi:hypothetical protein